MLDATLTNQLTSYLTMLREPVELLASLDESPKSAQVAELLDEIAAASDKVTVRRTDDDARRPSFGVAPAGETPRVRFAGLPLGHEFTSLVLALLWVGGHPPKVDPATLAAIRAVPGEHHFETYMSLTCQNCPDVVQALTMMSVLNPGIWHVAVEGGTFQDEIDARQVLAVPTVYRDGELFAQGRASVEELLARLDTTAAGRDVERIGAMPPFDVLVVGGGPAGASAAVYAARKGIRTGLVAERLGGQVLDTLSIENLVSVIRTEGPTLGAALEAHVREYDVQILAGQQVVKIVPAAEPGALVGVDLANGAHLRARAVVVAPGARWRTMGVPGEDEYRNKGVTFCPHCDGPLFKGKHVAVIGGGNSGIEAAIDLAGVVDHVTVVEFLDELRADAVLQRALHSLPNTDVVLNAKTTAVLGDGTRVTGLDYQDRTTGQAQHLDLDGVFVQIGLLPNTGWLDGTLELNPRKEIVTDERGTTSSPGIFAAGDATTTPYKQIVIAIGTGATAALTAFDYLVHNPALTPS